VTAVLPAVEPVYDPRRLASMVMLALVDEGVPVAVRSAERVFEECARLLRTLGVEAVDDYAEVRQDLTYLLISSIDGRELRRA